MKRLIIPLLLSISTLGVASTEVIAEWVALESIEDAIISTGQTHPELSNPDWRRIAEVVSRDTETNVITHTKGYTLAAVTVGAGGDIGGTEEPPVVEEPPVTVKDRYLLYKGTYTDISPPVLLSMVLIGDEIYLLSKDLDIESIQH